jgi:hypothetical protein
VNEMALSMRADRIRPLVNVARGCIAEVGRELIEAKALCAHGRREQWFVPAYASGITRLTIFVAYCRAIAMRIASSGETRWSEFSAVSAIESCTPLTRPVKALPREP